MTSPGLLVIGALQWKYASGYLDKFPGFDVSVISVSGMQVHEVDSSMLKAVEFFEDVVIHLGTNNLICGESPEEVIHHHINLVDAILDRNPGVRLYISSVLRRSTSRFSVASRLMERRIEVLNGKVEELNVLLEDMSERYGLCFIDNWAAFEAMDQDPYHHLLSKDGLHLTPRGVQCLIGNVVSLCLRECDLVRASSNRPTVCPSVQHTLSPSSRSSPLQIQPQSAHSSNFPALPPSSGPSTPRPSVQHTLSPSSRSSPLQIQPQSAHSSNFPALPPSSGPSTPRPSVQHTLSPSSRSSPLQIQPQSAYSSNFPALPPSSGPSTPRPSVQHTLSPSSRSSPLQIQPQSAHSASSLVSRSFIKIKRTKHHIKNLETSPFLIPTSNRWSVLESLCEAGERGVSRGMSKSWKMPKLNSCNNTHSEKTIKCKRNKSSTLLNSSKIAKSFHKVPLSTITVNTANIFLPRYDVAKKNFNINSFCGGSKEGDATESVYPRQCEACNKVYANKSSFCHHKKKCLVLPEKITYPRVCSECKTSYSCKSSFSKHKSNCSNMMAFNTCPHSACGIKFRTSSIMIDHLQSCHHEDISVENYVFKDMLEFAAWKRKQFQMHHVCMVRHCGEHVNGNDKFLYYICKFDNHHKHEVVSNKTSVKRKIGRMPNSDCVARMSVKENESGVFVKYVNAHNHENEFKNLKFFRWDSETKFQITSLLEQGVPAHNIQESLQPADLDLKEMLPLKEHFISSTQINKMKYQVNSKKHLSPDDAVSVHLLVNSMRGEGKDSILIYKPLGQSTEIGDKGLDKLPHANELFVLGIQHKLQREEMVMGCTRILCMDSTHATNQYKFHLLNLVVPDEYGVGYPVAHFITSHLDEETLTYLLRTMVNRCPGLFVNAVMTDGDEALGNAARRVFGGSTKHLLCLWHVKKCWRNNLKQKVKNNKSLVNEINDHLETLIEEKNDLVFNELLKSFLAKYSDSAASFIKYFRDFYCSKKEKWAMCYRNFPHAATDTNMFVESYHNKLKSIYLGRKVNRRLDDLVHLLFKIHKTTYFRVMDKRLSAMPQIGFQKYHSDHRKGMAISDEDIMPTTNEMVWTVRSQSDPSVMHHVTKVSDKCLHTDLCFISCNEVSCRDLCSHLFHCSCLNNYVLCKHIHKVNSFLIRNRPRDFFSQDSNLSSPDKLFKSSFPVPDNQQEDQKSENLIHSIGQLLNKLKTLTPQCTSALLPHVKSTLKILVERCESVIANGNCGSIPSTIEHQSIPPNSKLIPQLKLHQIMRKRKKIGSPFKRPNQAKRSHIKNQLLLDKDDSHFMEPIGDGVDPFMPICKVGSVSVSLYEMKSLDFHMTEEEVDKLKESIPDFHKGWLYDSVIAAFLGRIAAHNPSVYVVDPSESQYVTEHGPGENFYLYKLDLSSTTKIIIPSNVNNNHWILLVAWPNEKIIDFYDPADAYVKDSYRYAINRWMQVLIHKFGGKGSEWKLLVPEHTLQEDNYNCGVFVSWYAERVLLGEATVQSFNPNTYRKYMHDIIKGIMQI